jgi:hypothetical protein
VRDRVDEIAVFIATNDALQSVYLDKVPASDELGREWSQTIVSNSHVETIVLTPVYGVAIRDVSAGLER